MQSNHVVNYWVEPCYSEYHKNTHIQHQLIYDISVFTSVRNTVRQPPATYR